MSDKTFRPWEPDQQMLFPSSVRDFVPEGHLAHFVRDVVRDDLDLSAIFARYTERRGTGFRPDQGSARFPTIPAPGSGR